jgi:hypothetical protein
MGIRLRHMALHHKVVSGFVDEEREMGGKWNSVSVGNQDREWIRSHESEDSGAIFLAIEFGYVHFRVSE